MRPQRRERICGHAFAINRGADRGISRCCDPQGCVRRRPLLRPERRVHGQRYAGARSGRGVAADFRRMPCRLPWLGVYRGRDSPTHFLAHMHRNLEVTEFGLRDVISEGSKAAAFGWFRLHALSTGAAGRSRSVRRGSPPHHALRTIGLTRISTAQHRLRAGPWKAPKSDALVPSTTTPSNEIQRNSRKDTEKI